MDTTVDFSIDPTNSVRTPLPDRSERPRSTGTPTTNHEKNTTSPKPARTVQVRQRPRRSDGEVPLSPPSRSSGSKPPKLQFAPSSSEYPANDDQKKTRNEQGQFTFRRDFHPATNPATDPGAKTKAHKRRFPHGDPHDDSSSNGKSKIRVVQSSYNEERMESLMQAIAARDAELQRKENEFAKLRLIVEQLQREKEKQAEPQLDPDVLMQDMPPPKPSQPSKSATPEVVADDESDADMVDPKARAIPELFNRKRKLSRDNIQPWLEQVISPKKKYPRGRQGIHLKAPLNPPSTSSGAAPASGSNDSEHRSDSSSGAAPASGSNDSEHRWADGTAAGADSNQSAEIAALRAELEKVKKLYEDFASTHSARPWGRKGRAKNTEFCQINRPLGAREEDRVTFLREVRHMQQRLLGIEQDREIVEVYVKDINAGTAITSDDELHFLDGLEDALEPQLKPVMRPFWPVLRGPWNQALSDLFVEAYIEKYPTHADKREDIQETFFERLERQKRYLMAAGRCTDDPAELLLYAKALALRMQKNARVNERRLTVHWTRVNIAFGYKDTDPNWQILFDMVQKLGPQGQSSDETPDTDAEDAPYPVRVREWRSSEVLNLLKFIDQHRNILSVYGNPKPGTRPHRRIRTGPISLRRAICSLPSNFYRKSFLDSLNPNQLKQLDVKAPLLLPRIGDSTDP